MTNRLLLALVALLAAASTAAQDHSSAEARGKPVHSIRRLRQRSHAERVAAPTAFQALCDRRLTAGAAGRHEPPIDLSVAHALVREFSVSSAYATSDIALAAAFEQHLPTSPDGGRALLARYTEGRDDVCVAHAGATGLSQARIVQAGRVAVVRPGTGAVVLAPDTDLEVIDLRDL